MNAAFYLSGGLPSRGQLTEEQRLGIAPIIVAGAVAVAKKLFGKKLGVNKFFDAMGDLDKQVAQYLGLPASDATDNNSKFNQLVDTVRAQGFQHSQVKTNYLKDYTPEFEQYAKLLANTVASAYNRPDVIDFVLAGDTSAQTSEPAKLTVNPDGTPLTASGAGINPSTKNILIGAGILAGAVILTYVFRPKNKKK